MGYMSPLHWMLVLLIIILLFGAKRIPDIAKGLGQGLKEFKKATKEGMQDSDQAAKPPEKLEKKDDAGA